MTYLPKRFEDGLVKQELVAIQWHPQLVASHSSSDVLGGLDPAPGYYEVFWESDASGTLITTTGASLVKAHEKASFSVTDHPLKYFPLIFSPRYCTASKPHETFQSFYFSKDGRRGIQLKKWADEFYRYTAENYQLSLPWKQVFIIQVPGNREEIHIINNLILVPTPHYQRTALMDRRVLGFFSRGLGGLWFGETVWNNTDTQLWLSLGLPGFLGLNFYEFKYGKDAPIFEFIDWLNPHYKEHFFESMVSNIRPEFRIPLLSSAQKQVTTPSGKKITIDETRVLARLLHYQSPLVISMLEYVMGKPAFQQGLLKFTQKFSQKMATEKDFQEALEEASGSSLEWFFQQWFHEIPELDYSLQQFETEELPGGNYQTRVTIKQEKRTSMPVEVALTLANGSVLKKRTSRQGIYETLTFFSKIPPEKVSLDPDEILLETSRLNNHSSSYLRIRPFFDWKKRREVLVLLRPMIMENAFDGKLWGLVTTYRFNEFYDLTTALGYGTKSHEVLYEVALSRQQLYDTNFGMTFRAFKRGGIEAQSIGGSYSLPDRRENLSYGVLLELSKENAISVVDHLAETSEDHGDTSNIAVALRGSIGFKNIYSPEWRLRVEQPLKDLGADFLYTRINGSIDHLFHVGFKKSITWSWIYGSIYGHSPIQKKHQLGGPEVLRGFPNRLTLRNDNLLAMRTTYEFPLVSSPWWGNVSSLGLQGSLFYDQGKIWGNDSKFDHASLRQDIGIGLQWHVDALALLQPPITIEIAYPINDPHYNKPQIILLKQLGFF